MVAYCSTTDRSKKIYGSDLLQYSTFIHRESRVTLPYQMNNENTFLIRLLQLQRHTPSVIEGYREFVGYNEKAESVTYATEFLQICSQ